MKFYRTEKKHLEQEATDNFFIKEKVAKIRGKKTKEDRSKPHCHLMSWNRNVYDPSTHNLFAVPHKRAYQAPVGTIY